MKNNKRLVESLKYSCYALLLIALYVLQTTPNFLGFGVKPFLVIPAAVCIAMYEGEFVGGIFGVLGGLLCDMASYTVFGFYSILLLLICTAVGLLVIYYMKNTRLNALLLCAAALGALGLLEHFFYYALWGYEGSGGLFWLKTVPRVLFSLLFVPLFHWLVGRASEFFAAKVKS